MANNNPRTNGTCPECGKRYQQKMEWKKYTKYCHDIRDESKDCIVTEDNE